MKDLLRKIGDWAENYGWSIPVFLIGILVGLSIGILMDGSLRLFEVVAAWGTLSAAFAAFWSINFSRRVQRRRDEQEDKLRQPRLRAVNAWPGEHTSLVFQLVNLGSETVFVTYVGSYTIPSAVKDFEAVNLTLKSGESQTVMLSGQRLYEEDEPRPELFFFFLFYSGSLGPVLYRLSLPYAVEKDGGAILDYGGQTIDIEEYQEAPLPGILEPSEEMKRFLESLNKYSKF